MLTPKSFLLFLSQSELLLKPLGNGCLVDMQEQIPFLIPYHLCCDIIGKNVAPVLIRIQPPTIIDGQSVQQFVGLFYVKTTSRSFRWFRTIVFICSCLFLLQNYNIFFNFASLLHKKCTILCNTSLKMHKI